MATKRLSVTVDPELLDEAVRVTGAESQREAIDVALRELVRRRGVKRMVERAGTVELTQSVEDLLEERWEE